MKKKNQSRDKEPKSQKSTKKSALDCLQNFIKSNEKNSDVVETASSNILVKLRERIEEIGDRNYTIELDKDDITRKKNSTSINCAACLMPIEKGDIALSMPCCGSLCHVSCMAKISNSHRTLMDHACPHCITPLTEEQEDLFINLYQEIELSKQPAQ